MLFIKNNDLKILSFDDRVKKRIFIFRHSSEEATGVCRRLQSALKQDV
jgi:hypothetical protein